MYSCRVNDTKYRTKNSSYMLHKSSRDARKVLITYHLWHKVGYLLHLFKTKKSFVIDVNQEHAPIRKLHLHILNPKVEDVGKIVLQLSRRDVKLDLKARRTKYIKPIVFLYLGFVFMYTEFIKTPIVKVSLYTCL